MTESPLVSVEASNLSKQQVAPATAASEENTADKIIEENHAPARLAASNGHVPHNAAKPDQPHVSRFANLGPNAHLIKNAGQKDTGAIKSTHKPFRANDVQPNSTVQQRKVI